MSPVACAQDGCHESCAEDTWLCAAHMTAYLAHQQEEVLRATAPMVLPMPHAFTDLPWVYWVSYRTKTRHAEVGRADPGHLVHLLLGSGWNDGTAKATEARELAWLG